MNTTINNQTLSERYRPTTMDDLVLAPSTADRLDAFRHYLAHPRPTAWLFHGDTGLGKTTLARIAVQHFKRQFQAHIISEAGARVRDELVADWNRGYCTHGWFYDEPTLFFIDEADAMSQKAMFGLRTVIEAGYANNCHWILTSNQPPEKFGAALKSRLQAIGFSDQGLAPRMAEHLVRIGQKEGYPLSEKEAMTIVRRQSNDIRGALNDLDRLISESQFRENFAEKRTEISML